MKSTGEDSVALAEFLGNIQPPKEVEKLGALPDEEAVLYADKAFFDSIMWQADQRERLHAALAQAESLQRNNNYLNRLLRSALAEA